MHIWDENWLMNSSYNSVAVAYAVWYIKVADRFQTMCLQDAIDTDLLKCSERYSISS